MELVPLSNSEIAAVAVVGRSDWDAAARGSGAGSGGWPKVFDDVGAKCLSTLLPVLNDAARRESIAAGVPPQQPRTPESFLIAALRVCVLATMTTPTSAESERLARAGLSGSTSLTLAEVQAECATARYDWDQACAGRMGHARWFNSLDALSLRVLSTLKPCVGDAAIRIDLAADRGFTNPGEALEAFVIAAIRVAAAAVASPAGDELVRLDHAGASGFH